MRKNVTSHKAGPSTSNQTPRDRWKLFMADIASLNG
jgi:hypothetical protein